MNQIFQKVPGALPVSVGMAVLIGAGLMLTGSGELASNPGAPSNRHAADRQLIVIAAPSVKDKYYKKHFDKIIDFDVRMARAVMGKDNIVVLVDADTMPYLEKRLPADVLLEAEVSDIWLRDFGSVHPERMVQFQYDRPRERYVQKSLRALIDRFGLDIKRSRLKVDGGNVVDNAGDSVILTEKVFERNRRMNEDAVFDTLQRTLGAKQIAFIPMDDEYLGHSDGMVMFLGPRKVLVNRYRSDPKFGAEVKRALREGLPGVTISEIDGEGYGEQYGRFASACGIYVNSTVTYRHIYTPTFGDGKDGPALRTIQSGTRKQVVPIQAREVCKLGGSVRCLSWQLTGENARKLIEAARRY